MKQTKNSQQSASISLRKQPKQLDLIEWINKKQAKEAIEKYERETSNKLRSEIPGNSEPGELQKQNSSATARREILEIRRVK